MIRGLHSGHHGIRPSRARRRSARPGVERVQNGSVAELKQDAAATDARAAVHALTRAARMLERTVAERTTPELSMADFRMLSAVAGGEARASRLAQRLAIGKPAVSGSVDSLVRRGLLARTAHGADARAVDLTLTPDGERVRDEAEAALAELITDIARRTPDPAATLAALAAFGQGLEARQVEVAATHLAARSAASAPASAATPVAEVR
jgi:DNA-binding MarR family transcriptional regulator